VNLVQEQIKIMTKVYEQQKLSHSQRARTQNSANGISSMIRRHFTELPQSRLSPSEFKALYKLSNPIHSIRPRFTDLANPKKTNTVLLQRLDNDKIQTPYDGEEARYALLVNNELSLL
jgi:hypothetical protein